MQACQCCVCHVVCGLGCVCVRVHVRVDACVCVGVRVRVCLHVCVSIGSASSPCPREIAVTQIDLYNGS